MILSHANVIRVGVIGKQENAASEVSISFVRLRKAETGIENI